MKLLSHEYVLVRSNDDKIVLTNLRIYMQDKTLSGNFYEISIFLEDIASIEYMYQSNVVYLILGILTALGMFGNNPFYNMFMYYWLILSGTFFTVWLMGRGHFIRICPKGGKSLAFRVDKMSKEQVDDFLDKVQEAKHARSLR